MSKVGMGAIGLAVAVLGTGVSADCTAGLEAQLERECNRVDGIFVGTVGGAAEEIGRAAGYGAGAAVRVVPGEVGRQVAGAVAHADRVKTAVGIRHRGRVSGVRHGVLGVEVADA